MPRRLRIGLLLASLVLLLTVVAAAANVTRELAAPHDQGQSSFAGSAACRSCHPQHSESWHRTFHRRMTQVASPQTVLGDFDRGQLTYGGIQARMRMQDGRPTIAFSTNGGATRWSATVDRTVGSHRMQQYLARDGDSWLRLPVAWDVEQSRWIHMNGAFLTPDPERVPGQATIARNDYDRHVTRWNDNCVFCHNVAPNPGVQEDGTFETSVAELAVACEACHGPGADHARYNRNPLRRYALHLGAWFDPTIANPSRMGAARSNEVCGRCHGQRKASDIDRVLREGDTFLPGTPLSAHSTPLARDTSLNGEAGVFAPRFWNDGTPRLTAYEYQGLLQSPCAVRGELKCGSCHAMHDSDPDLQLRNDIPSDNGLCTQCHADLASADQAARHSHHEASSTGNQCRACHMPNIVYGIVAARISHRVETPSPEDSAQQGRPDACTLCHVDRSRAWAAASLRQWRGNTSPGDTTAAALPETPSRLFGGDPIERALAAAALGRPDTTEDNRADRIAWLLDALANDRYPAVRRIAQRALLQLVPTTQRDARTAIDALSPTEIDPETRASQVNTVKRLLGPVTSTAFTPEVVRTLRSSARALDIEIGE